jgi:phenylpropionate dioxygenase-like ring-hydroxylating dioxygenase large terminal subunit
MLKPLARRRVDHQDGVRILPNVEHGALAAKAPYIDYGTDLVDVRRYIDPAEAEREWEKFWTKIWTLAGIASDIPNPGDWFKYDLGRESFIVVRGDDHKIRAFYNVCPHRGNRIVRNDFGTAGGGFQCAFHNWKFNIDGGLNSVREAETFRPEALAHATGLTAVACDEWAGLVFISMNPQPEPLLDFLGILPEHLGDFHFEKMRVLEDIVYMYDANWKTTADAFLEFYHAESVHPELALTMETYHCQYDLYPKGISRMILPFGYSPDKLQDTATVSADLKGVLMFYGGDPDQWGHLSGAGYATAIAAAKRQLAKREGWDHFDKLSDSQILGDWNYSIFPNVTINVFGEIAYFQIFRPHPTDPTKCVWRSIQLNLTGRTPQYRPMILGELGQNQDQNAPWDGSVRPAIEFPDKADGTRYVLAQDALLVPPVQQGMSSRAFKGYVLSEQEIRIRHYLAELDKYLAA